MPTLHIKSRVLMYPYKDTDNIKSNNALHKTSLYFILNNYSNSSVSSLTLWNVKLNPLRPLVLLMIIRFGLFPSSNRVTVYSFIVMRELSKNIPTRR